MKKIIIILLLILPVIVTVLIYMIAGFVGPAIQYHAVRGVVLNEQRAINSGWAEFPGQENTWQFINMHQGDQINLRNYLSTSPSRTTFDQLYIEIRFGGDETEIVTNNNGVLTANQAFQGATWVNVRVMYGSSVFFTLRITRIW